ncbi:MAG: hypothetical protein LBU65_03005 [Planctomycetaceae bacterium]|jgi:hypothetical protein|nr:hypothetical protein [Planctomycetaceae bacterium]
MKRFIILVLICCVLAISAACNRRPDRGTIPTTVTVKYNGEPVYEAVVVFMAADNFANGLTNKSGIAKMSTFEDGDGCIPNTYTVIIKKDELVEELDPNKPAGENVISSKTVFHVPQKYGESAKSGLTAVVEKDGKNNFVFELVD